MDNNYQLSRIHNYIGGLMSKEEMHAFEREALEDPFLQDAIEGYSMQNGVDAKKLSLLQKRLATRVEQYADQRNNRFFRWQRLAIGATAAVMFVSVCILLLIKYLPQPQKSGLSEVEILQESGYIITVNGSNSAAQPVDGWEEYQQYVDQHYSNTEDLQGRVYLSFRINEHGQPTHIKGRTDTQTLGTFTELQDLLANGPKWTGDKGEIIIDIQKR